MVAQDTAHTSHPRSFPPELRLKKRSDFVRVQDKGKKVFSKHFLLVLTAGKQDSQRLGITVSKRVDKRAVVRNTVKRRIREIFRTHRAKMTKTFDMVVIARQGSPDLSFDETKRELLKNLRKAGVMP